MLAGRINSWSCCKADEKDARGCKTSSSHIECEATSATLLQIESMGSFAKPISTQQKARQFESNKLYPTIDVEKEEYIDPSIDLTINLKSFRIQPDPVTFEEGKNFLDPDAQLVTENGQQYIKHIIKYTDTLRGLSLKYKVTPDEIKSANRITKDEDIWSHHVILVPYNGQLLRELNNDEKEKYRDEMRKRLVRRLMKTAKCTEAEAVYYLQINAFNLDNAVEEFKADIEWESQNQYKEFASIRA